MFRLVLILLALLGAVAPMVRPAAADDRGVCLEETSAPDAAIGACGRLISSGQLSGPDLARAHNNRARSYERKGDSDRAIADYSEALRLSPHAVIYANRAFNYSNKRDFERAMADVNQALKLDSKYARAYGIRGFVFAQKGDDDRAFADYNEAIRLDPTYASGYHNRAMIYQKRNDYARAVADFNKAAQFAPTESQVFVMRGAIHEKMGDLNAALADYREAVRLAPTKPGGAEAIRRVEQKIAARGPETRPETRPDTRPPTPPQVIAALPAPTPVPAVAAPDGRRVALVIGNGNYRHASVLANPANDAADIAQALRNLGFDVVEGRDLDKQGVEDKVREFGRHLDNAGLALFFYAGHGMQVGGKNYLVPIDARLERPGDLNLDAVDVGNVLAQMESEKRVNLVFLDACRDNPLARSFARSLGTRSAAVGQGLATIQSAIGTMIAYATQPDAVALDGEGRNSPFTAALLKHLSTPGLEIATLMRRVRADVIVATREKQVPWDHSSLIGEVILAR
jgi:tetratricopeptide (TPR) repeat protein